MYDAVNNVYQFAADEVPLQRDLQKFLVFKNETGKRYHMLDDIKTNTLQSWRNNEKLTVYVHQYSLSIANSSMFKAMERALLRPTNADRAGAINLQEVALMVCYIHNGLGIST